MNKYTQSNIAPGNCWQTAIACVLGIEPDLLPDQVLIERPREKRLFDGWCCYNNALQGYLRKHHGLIYVELPHWKMQALKAAPGLHILCGPTVRTAANGTHHCVVAENGVPVWDVHPSRAGLIEPTEWNWGVLLPRPTYGKAEEERQQRLCERDPGYKRIFLDCTCPACFDQGELA